MSQAFLALNLKLNVNLIIEMVDKQIGLNGRLGDCSLQSNILLQLAMLALSLSHSPTKEREGT